VGENCADDRAEVAAPMWAVHAVLGGISSVTVRLLCSCMSVCVCVCVCVWQGVHGARYEGVGCGVLGIQRLHVRLRTDRIRQDVHDDGRADGKLLAVPRK